VLLFGITGSGTTTTLLAIALSLAAASGPETLELYAVDYGTGALSVLDGLPHTGSVIAADDRERQVRLIRHLRAELDLRRGGPPRRRIVVLIDNLAAMRAEFDDIAGLELFDVLTRLYADGTPAGISFAVTADRFSTVPPAWASVTTHRWLFRLPEKFDYVQAGLTRRDVPAKPPGRMVALPGALQAQVGRPAPSAAAAVDAVARKYPDAARPAQRIGALPGEVPIDRLPPPEITGEPWHLPLGIRESDLQPAGLLLYEGEHALVAGPARCGKSTALLTLAAVLRGPARVAAIAGLLAANRPDLHVVAAGRSDALRSGYGHWTQAVRRSKAGILLRPNIDLDGDLLGMTLPRRAPVRLGVGRGYLIHNGEWDILQIAAP
jgi:S-DNA-T family DNA segregation ATPase FtsK/SpoIIIE